jgi:hypothetical protein
MLQINVNKDGKFTSFKEFVDKEGNPTNVDDKKAVDEINNTIKELKNPTNK